MSPKKQNSCDRTLHPGTRSICSMATPLLSLQSRTPKKPLLEQTWSNHDSHNQLHILVQWHLKSIKSINELGKQQQESQGFTLVRHKYREPLKGCGSSAQTQRRRASSRSARAVWNQALVGVPWSSCHGNASKAWQSKRIYHRKNNHWYGIV